MIIDIHTHVPARTQWDRFIAECLVNGVDVAVASSLGVSGWPPYPDSDHVSQANDHACSFAEFGGDMVLWFAYLNPQNPDWEAEFHR